MARKLHGIDSNPATRTEVMKIAHTRKTALFLLATLLVATGTRLAVSSESELRAVPEGFSTSLVGAKHDFDFLVGAWTTRQSRLKMRATGSREWVEAPANGHCAQSFM